MKRATEHLFRIRRSSKTARATLSGATLSGATLSGATLSGATLSGATLSGATLSGATLSRAATTEATATFRPTGCLPAISLTPSSFVGFRIRRSHRFQFFLTGVAVLVLVCLDQDGTHTTGQFCIA
uniref:pentapeptide repeat-containing protein n=1 Tax=Novipirellula artificiosorum TaxID=2528016 RepID=UPI0036F4048E